MPIKETPARIFRKCGLGFILGIIFNFLIVNHCSFIFFPLLIGIFYFLIIVFDFFKSDFKILIFLCFFFGLIRSFLFPEISFQSLVPASFNQNLQELRLSLSRQFEKNLSSEESALVNSLLFGGQDNLSFEMKEKFRKVGLSHVVAVSGYHLSVINQAIGYFQPVLNLPRSLFFLINLGLDAFFIGLTNFTPSVIRSGIMAFLVSLSFLNFRFYYPLNALFFSFLLMIFLQPSLLFIDIGFQLSFLSTLGIIYYLPILKRIVFKKSESFYPVSSFYLKIKNFCLELILLNLSVLIIAWPWLVYQFNEFSLISPLANLLILPVVPTIMFLSLALLFSSYFSFYLTMVIIFFLKIVLNYFFLIIDTLSALPYASVIISGPWRFLVLFYYGFLFYFTYQYQLKQKSLLYEKSS